MVRNHPTQTNVSSCQACHTPGLVRRGLSNVLNVNWHTAPSGQNFQSKSARQLCMSARVRPPTVQSVSDHLKRDPLILWAVIGGAFPNPSRYQREHGIHTRPKANSIPGFTLSSWRNAVDAWVNAGMPCP